MFFLLQAPPPDFTDFIGFLISLFAVLYLIIRSIRAKRYRQEHPKEAAMEEEKQRETLKKFLKSLEGDMDEMEEEEVRPRIKVVKTPPPAPASIAKKQPKRKVADEFHSNLEQRKLVTVIEKRRLESSVEARKLDSGINIGMDDMRAYAKKSDYIPPSHATTIISRLHSKRDMLVLHEIFKSPKAFDNEGRRDRF